MGQRGGGASQVISDSCCWTGLLKGDKKRALGVNADSYQFVPG